MYLLHEKGLCGVTYMAMTMNWSWSVATSTLKTAEKSLALNQLEFQMLESVHPGTNT